jgi:DNA-binding LytR/AlgR family response regulator
MLEIILCTYPELDAALRNRTRDIINDYSPIKAYAEDKNGLEGLLRKPAAAGLVAVLSDRGKTADERRDMVLQIRARFSDAYIIYISESPYDDLLYLTNRNARLSAYLTRPPYEEEYARALSYIFEDYIRKTTGNDRFYTLVADKQTHTLLVDDIILFESRKQNKKTAMITRSRTIEFYKSLTDIENDLKGRFIRCHSGFLINTTHIRGVNFKDRTITLNGNITIPFSQKHRDDVSRIIGAVKDIVSHRGTENTEENL